MTEHTDNDCPCGPIPYRLCPECDGSGCWRCVGPYPGLCVATAAEADDEEISVIWLHRTEDGSPCPQWVMQEVEAGLRSETL